jgi:RND family efflux transporter MFP subunit
LELPCDLVAMIESPILARVEGYISKRAVEIGSRVKKGDLMVELETPELDQQIRQAQAAVSQARAAWKQTQAQIGQVRAELSLAKITTERWKKLNAEGVISIQDADEKQAQFDVKIAELEAAQATAASSQEAVRASEANLNRLEELKSFARMTAPFDGIVTYRNPDVGTLISAGASGKEIFRVADISTIRAFVSIPQSHVPIITPGLAARLSVDDIPGREWQAPVSNIAYALDPSSRTMLAVIKVRNPDYALKPGMYSRAKFALPTQAKSLLLPGDAIIGRGDGSYVAIVNQMGRVHYQKVTVSRDFGAKVAVIAGVTADDIVILSPSDDVREGTKVETRAAVAAR